MMVYTNMTGDSLEFLSWFLNSLDRSLKGSESRGLIESIKKKQQPRRKKTIVGETFRGKMRVFTKKLPPIEMKEKEKAKLMLLPDYQEVSDSQFHIFLCYWSVDVAQISRLDCDSFQW